MHVLSALSFKKMPIFDKFAKPRYLPVQMTLPEIVRPIQEIHLGVETWELPGGILHREDGPALIHNNGQAEWYLFGEEISPLKWALTLGFTGETPWVESRGHSCHDARAFWKEGLLHREDGPAIFHEAGWVKWYLEGKQILDEAGWGLCTKFNGVIECPNGYRSFWKKGLLHNESGPARFSRGIYHGHDPTEWYLEGDLLSREDWMEETQFSGVIDFGGRREQIVKGQIHREDGPAVEYKNGVVSWWFEGRPMGFSEWGLCTGFSGVVEVGAKDWMDDRGQEKLYFEKGLLHREDGPAIEMNNLMGVGNSYQIWCLKGKTYDKSEWEEELAILSMIRKSIQIKHRRRRSQLAEEE